MQRSRTNGRRLAAPGTTAPRGRPVRVPLLCSEAAPCYNRRAEPRAAYGFLSVECHAWNPLRRGSCANLVGGGPGLTWLRTAEAVRNRAPWSMSGSSLNLAEEPVLLRQSEAQCLPLLQMRLVGEPA